MRARLNPPEKKEAGVYEENKPPITQIKGTHHNTLDVTVEKYISSLRKRGYKPEAFAKFIEQRGLTEADKVIASKDFFEVIEKSHSYDGYYFILGGTVPILEGEPEKKIRSKELLALVGTRATKGLKEIIVATSLNPEGENTFDCVAKLLSLILKEFNIKLSGLGRGLSTGTELEYSDSDTIKNALKNRF